jgi:hypothetical protein
MIPAVLGLAEDLIIRFRFRVDQIVARRSAFRFQPKYPMNAAPRANIAKVEASGVAGAADRASAEKSAAVMFPVKLFNV